MSGSRVPLRVSPPVAVLGAHVPRSGRRVGQNGHAEVGRLRRPSVEIQMVPALTGMVPTSTSSTVRRTTGPRARGDGPAAQIALAHLALCSPSPRGRSRALQARPVRPQLLPATAGMDPSAAHRRALATPAPRARGMIPSWPLRPEVSVSAPRARGNGPDARRLCLRWTACSPRPREWPHCLGLGRWSHGLLPAPAGIVPRRPVRWMVTGSAPRACEDGPRNPACATRSACCSPRPRE